MDKTEDLGCLPNGAHIFRKENPIGGHSYYSDEIGGGTLVWDTCLVSEGTLLTAIACEHHRKYLQYMVDKRGWKPTLDMEQEVMAATGGSFCPSDNRDMDDVDDDLKILAIECYLAYENRDTTENITEKTSEQFDKCDIGWKRDWVRVARKCANMNGKDEQ